MGKFGSTLFIGLVASGFVGLLCSSCRNEQTVAKSPPKKQPFVIHFEDLASLDPKVDPSQGLVIDRKNNSITAEPKVEKIILEYGGGKMKLPCIECQVTFNISHPLFGSELNEAKISKGGDILVSSVSWEAQGR